MAKFAKPMLTEKKVMDEIDGHHADIGHVAIMGKPEPIKNNFNIKNLTDFLRFIDRSLQSDSKASDVFVEVDTAHRRITLVHEGSIETANTNNSGTDLVYSCRLNKKFSALKEVCGKTFELQRAEGLDVLESLSRDVFVKTEVISIIAGFQAYVPPFMQKESVVSLTCALENLSLAACEACARFANANTTEKHGFEKKAIKMRTDFETLKVKAYEVLTRKAGENKSDFQAVILIPVSIFIGGPVVLLELTVLLRAVDANNIIVQLDIPDGIDYIETAFRKISDVLNLRSNVILLEPSDDDLNL